jgi:HEPN domain-containing protein
MYAEISKNAVLFYKALQDLWCAEQTYTGSPNNAVWSCCQTIEKSMKGLLQCYNIDAGGSHDLSILLEDIEKETELSSQTVKFIHALARYDQRLRYKNLKSDPTVEEAKVLINNTMEIMNEISNHPKCSEFINEAKEVYAKLLKANASE